MASYLCRRSSPMLKAIFTANTVTQARSLSIPVLQTARSFSSSKDDDGKKPDIINKPKIDLAKPNKRRQSKKSDDVDATTTPSSPDISPELLHSVKTISEKLGGNQEKTESDLLQQLRAHSEKTEFQKQKYSEPDRRKPVDMSSLFAGMKVEKDSRKISAAGKFHEKSNSIGIMDKQKSKQRSLFEGARLNIFDECNEKPESLEAPTNSIFDKADEREIEILLDVPPSNAFEEMIQWTNQGILWKFPIDNDQGRDVESNYSFKDHIFLDKHLTEFPKKGPLRHFMELVCVGLSKNHWITVDEKVDHINWFKDYFKDKMELLQYDEAINNQIPQ